MCLYLTDNPIIPILCFPSYQEYTDPQRSSMYSHGHFICNNSNLVTTDRYVICWLDKHTLVYTGLIVFKWKNKLCVRIQNNCVHWLRPNSKSHDWQSPFVVVSRKCKWKSDVWLPGWRWRPGREEWGNRLGWWILTLEMFSQSSQVSNPIKL